MKVGVFGGSFDPVHVGHLAVARDAAEALGLDRVLLVPTARSPFKDRAPEASAPVRLRMLAEAVAGDARLLPSDVETVRDPPSYTYDTLFELGRAVPEAQLVLLFGVDQWAGFGRWHRAREIARMAEIAVLARSGERAADVDPGFGEGAAPECAEVPVTRIDISSTEIRRRVREGRSIRWLVPDAVGRIIETERLYL